MKNSFIGASVLALTLLSQLALGQLKETSAIFPSYQQIKGKNYEILDYVSPNGTLRVEKAPLNLFDYPPGTATYIINGKPYEDVNQVKQILSGKEKYLETLSISKPDQSGKRVILIRYELPE